MSFGLGIGNITQVQEAHGGRAVQFGKLETELKLDFPVERRYRQKRCVLRSLDFS